MVDKLEELSTKFALLFAVIFCANNTTLPHVRYDKLLQSNENFLNEFIDDFMFDLK